MMEIRTTGWKCRVMERATAMLVIWHCCRPGVLQWCREPKHSGGCREEKRKLACGNKREYLFLLLSHISALSSFPVVWGPSQ